MYALNNVILGNGGTGVDLTIGRRPQIVSLNQDVQFNVTCNVSLLSPLNYQLCHFNIYDTPQLATLTANPFTFSCSRNYSDLNWWLMKYNTTHFVNLQKLNASGFTFDYTFNSSLDNDLIIVCGTKKNSTIHVLGIGAFRANISSSRTTPTTFPAGHEQDMSNVSSIGDDITSNVTLSDNGETRSNTALSLVLPLTCLVVGIIIGICSVLIGLRISSKLKSHNQPEIYETIGSINADVELGVISGPTSPDMPGELQQTAQIDEDENHTQMDSMCSVNFDDNYYSEAYSEPCCLGTTERSTSDERFLSERLRQETDVESVACNRSIQDTCPGKIRHTYLCASPGACVLQKEHLSSCAAGIEDSQDAHASSSYLKHTYFTANDLVSRSSAIEERARETPPAIAKCDSLNHAEVKPTEEQFKIYLCKNCVSSLASTSATSNS